MKRLRGGWWKLHIYTQSDPFSNIEMVTCTFCLDLDESIKCVDGGVFNYLAINIYEAVDQHNKDQVNTSKGHSEYLCFQMLPANIWLTFVGVGAKNLKKNREKKIVGWCTANWIPIGLSPIFPKLKKKRKKKSFKPISTTRQYCVSISFPLYLANFNHRHQQNFSSRPVHYSEHRAHTHTHRYLKL